MPEDELIDVVDEDENVVETLPKAQTRKKNLLRRGGVVIVLNSKREILVHRRAFDKAAEPGRYDFLTGGWVLSGETPEQAAKREVEEEAGVRSDLEFLFRFRFKSGIHNDITYVYRTVYDGPIVPQEEEVESYEFVPLEKFDQYMEEHDFCEDAMYVYENYRDKIVYQKK